MQLSPKKHKNKNMLENDESGLKKKTSRKHFPETKASRMIKDIDKGKLKDVGDRDNWTGNAWHGHFATWMINSLCAFCCCYCCQDI